MKRLLVIFIMSVLVLTAVLYSSTVTTDKIYRPAWKSMERLVEFESDVNNVSVSIGIIQGKLTGITIMPTGTDTSFKVYVDDEDSVAVFTNESCSSANGNVRFAISHSDTGSTEFAGVPVDGAVTVRIADANDATLTDLDIKVYYEEAY